MTEALVVMPTNPLAEQLSNLTATVADMQAQRTTYMAGTVTALDNVNFTFAADVLQPDATTSNVAGIRTTAQFMPSIGTVVTLALSGPQIIYMPFGVANGSIDTAQLSTTVTGNISTANTNATNATTTATTANSTANTALTAANGKNKVTYSTNAASGSGTATGDLWFQTDVSGVVIASWAWTGSAWVAHNFGDAVLNSLTAGKITAGTMAAAVTISGRFATALTGARVELNSAGLQKWDASNNQTVSITGTSNLFTGQIQTGLTGQRLIINAGGTNQSRIDFYPSTGTAFASIEANTVAGQGAVTMSATSGVATAQSGVMLVRAGFASMSYSTPDQTTVTTEIYVDPGTARTRAQIVDLQANGNASTPGGTRISLGVNYITDCWVNFWGSIYNEPMFSAPNKNVGFVFSSNVAAGAASRMYITGGGGTAVDLRQDIVCGNVIYTGALVASSSRKIKKDVAPVTDVNIKASLKAARAQRYVIPQRGMPAQFDNKGNQISPAVVAPVQLGLIAEDLPAAVTMMLPNVFNNSPDVLCYDLHALVALIWNGLGDTNDDVTALTARVAALEKGPKGP